MAKEYYCYPREGFVPEVCTHEGLCLAHAQGTPFWLSEKGDVFIRYANKRWHRRIVDNVQRRTLPRAYPHGTGLDWLHSRWLAGRSYQRRHQQLDARQHPYRDRGGELPMRGYTAGKAHGGTARQ